MQKWGLEILSLSSLIVDVPTVVCLKFKTFLSHYLLGWSDLVLFVIFENEQFLEVHCQKNFKFGCTIAHTCGVQKITGV